MSGHVMHRQPARVQRASGPAIIRRVKLTPEELKYYRATAKKAGVVDPKRITFKDSGRDGSRTMGNEVAINSLLKGSSEIPPTPEGNALIEPTHPTLTFRLGYLRLLHQLTGL